MLSATATVVVLLLGLGGYVAIRFVLREAPRAIPADVVGDWGGADGASLSLRDDSGFAALNLPVQIQVPARFSAPWSGSGGWRLSNPDRYGSQYVMVTLDGYGVPLQVEKTDEDTRLYLIYNEPGQSRRFWLDQK
ncbi:hypothetical protein ACFFMM_06695 [Micromonospora chaiyaphumensis]|uniref:Uncharacterized protein n=1 Tax=Micromonospora chaiyaphumensis TaxID=307119 RepID=A0A1C4VLF6_9ACTN|nr:hypothetical protein [Micromonospora chaiyaphumensis]SCE84631.1 hypothetical protein GA0070214_102490 [Micromonospora chaiyaphumensis]